MAKKKVPEYTLQAINRYNAKWDRVAVNLNPGSKAWIAEHTGKSCNAFFQELYEKYKQEYEDTYGTDYNPRYTAKRKPLIGTE